MRKKYPNSVDRDGSSPACAQAVAGRPRRMPAERPCRGTCLVRDFGRRGWGLGFLGPTELLPLTAGGCRGPRGVNRTDHAESDVGSSTEQRNHRLLMTVVLTRGIVTTPLMLKCDASAAEVHALRRFEQRSSPRGWFAKVWAGRTRFANLQAKLGGSAGQHALSGIEELAAHSDEFIDRLGQTIFAGCAGAPCGQGFVCDRCNQMVLMTLEQKVRQAVATGRRAPCLKDGLFSTSLTSQARRANSRRRRGPNHGPFSRHHEPNRTVSWLEERSAGSRQLHSSPMPTTDGWVDAIAAVSEMPAPWLSVEHAVRLLRRTRAAHPS